MFCEASIMPSTLLAGYSEARWPSVLSLGIMLSLSGYVSALSLPAAGAVSRKSSAIAVLPSAQPHPPCQKPPPPVCYQHWMMLHGSKLDSNGGICGVAAFLHDVAPLGLRAMGVKRTAQPWLSLRQGRPVTAGFSGPDMLLLMATASGSCSHDG